jgi:hypothetical protein
LSKEEVRKSPDINIKKPVSKKHQIVLQTYYGWPAFWPMSEYALITPLTEEKSRFEFEKEDSHLRSVREINGYHIQATDGEIGHVADFILDDEDWNIYYIVIDTGKLIPGKSVLLTTEWITDVRWIDRSVDVDLTKEAVKNCHEYNPSNPVNKAL